MKHTKAHNKKISKSCIKSKVGTWNKGRKLTETHKRNIGEARKNKNTVEKQDIVRNLRAIIKRVSKI
jgi:hypothetical protein